MKTEAIRPVMVIVLLLLLVSPAASQVPDDKLIVPGQRIGKWNLEITIQDLVTANGPQNRGTDRPIFAARGSDFQLGITEHSWLTHGLIAGTTDGQKVLYLKADQAPDFKTEKGIGWLSTSAAAQSAYGNPTTVTASGPGLTTRIYDGLGIAFRLEAGGETINSIFVFSANSAKSIWRF